jgi:hypothetical protein
MKISAGKLLMGLMPLLLMSQGWAQSPATVAPGNYECWGNGSPRLLLNFKITGKDRYTNPDGKSRGSFAYNAATSAISFKGGHLDGVMPDGFTSIYHEPHGKPTVSFRSGRGAEASFCERAGK